MTKIIQLSEFYSTYNQRLQETKTYLEEVREEIFTHMLDIATAGVWRDWMKDIKEGDVVYFSDNMVAESGDKMIEALWELCYKMEEVEDRLAGIRK